MDNNTIKIKLKIADFAHPMTIDRSKEEVYRAAAKLVDRRFLNYKERYKSVNDDISLPSWPRFVAAGCSEPAFLPTLSAVIVGARGAGACPRCKARLISTMSTWCHR